MDAYDKYLERAKGLQYTREGLSLLEDVMVTARRACLPLATPSEEEMKDRLEFKMSLAPAFALHEAFQVQGEDGYIVYSDEANQITRHYADGRVIIK